MACNDDQTHSAERAASRGRLWAAVHLSSRTTAASQAQVPFDGPRRQRPPWPRDCAEDVPSLDPLSSPSSALRGRLAYLIALRGGWIWRLSRKVRQRFTSCGSHRVEQLRQETFDEAGKIVTTDRPAALDALMWNARFLNRYGIVRSRYLQNIGCIAVTDSCLADLNHKLKRVQVVS